MRLNNIYFVQGETVDITVLIKNEDGSLATLSGYTAVFGSSIIGNRPMTVLEHELFLTLPSRDTLTLPSRGYRFEIKVKDIYGKIKSILIGNIIVLEGFVQFE